MEFIFFPGLFSPVNLHNEPEQKDFADEEMINTSLELSLQCNYMLSSIDFVKKIHGNGSEDYKENCREENSDIVSLELSLSGAHSTSKTKSHATDHSECSHQSREEVNLTMKKDNKKLELKSKLEDGLSLDLRLPNMQPSLDLNDDYSNNNRKRIKKDNKKLELKSKLEDGLSLELRLPNMQPSLDLNDGCSSNKRKRIKKDKKKPKLKSKLEDSLSLEPNLDRNHHGCSSSPTISSCSSGNHKKRKVEKKENSGALSTEQRPVIAIDHQDRWSIKKKLTESDIGNMSRLMLSSDIVKSHILPFWNSEQLSKIKDGLPVVIWDCDTLTEHKLHFKQWNNRANVFMKNWNKEFVIRRNLKKNDEIGLYWDIPNSNFKFSVLNRAPEH